MNKIQVLDCTLRDGGYCNQWKFGFQNIKKIISGLEAANLDIIECGFITRKGIHNQEYSKFNSFADITTVLDHKHNDKIYVAMINYGEYDIEEIPEYDGTSVDGIRVAFHKKNMREALALCGQIKAKGYKVFIQAMVSLNYTDKQFLEMIHLVNEISPYAFYIVDSFGMMKEKDLIRMFYMVEHNLNNDIWIGFHSHNNMQLAFSNAQRLTNIQTNRRLIVDSSVYGMGRGAGNLNTELFVEYLNDCYGKQYELKPLLSIIDEILNEFYQRNYWGYSLPNYLSAVHNAHPNYASYLDDKKTLTVENMNEIFNMMDPDKRCEYDKAYIENLYLKYMAAESRRENHASEIKSALAAKKVLLIAPGKSTEDEADKIADFAKREDVVTISVNFDYKRADTDYIFISNLRRFRNLPEEKYGKCIATSNIPSEDVYLQCKYHELINQEEAVRDNAGLMAIKFLMAYGVKEIVLAGFDGYSHDITENYGDSQMAFVTRNAVLDALNSGMKRVMSEYAKDMSITFLTTPKHVIF